ncbi:hypothetical protein PROFUN_05367 [Planoprotostelium fungivorum]|uniref:Uncharacterized protein n=1 Tax=Planoprotostelium fungivorum TaxID=1890364 RepID=A0A2P6NRE7_9EUKA|nr:hypothetical protein PROFUN_05367 [Planoprotostelium fungivorum]
MAGTIGQREQQIYACISLHIRAEGKPEVVKRLSSHNTVTIGRKRDCDVVLQSKDAPSIVVSIRWNPKGNYSIIPHVPLSYSSNTDAIFSLGGKITREAELMMDCNYSCEGLALYARRDATTPSRKRNTLPKRPETNENIPPRSPQAKSLSVDTKPRTPCSNVNHAAKKMGFSVPNSPRGRTRTPTKIETPPPPTRSNVDGEGDASELMDLRVKNEKLERQALLSMQQAELKKYKMEQEIEDHKRKNSELAEGRAMLKEENKVLTNMVKNLKHRLNEAVFVPEPIEDFSSFDATLERMNSQLKNTETDRDWISYHRKATDDFLNKWKTEIDQQQSPKKKRRIEEPFTL